MTGERIYIYIYIYERAGGVMFTLQKIKSTNQVHIKDVSEKERRGKETERGGK